MNQPSEPAIGIDLGTTFSCVSRLDNLGRPMTLDNAEGYHSTPSVILFDGEEVVVGKEAWSLKLVRRLKQIKRGDLIITWEAGQNSALDTTKISAGRDIGNVVVQRDGPNGPTDAVHDITFAFAFHAFYPKALIHTEIE